MTAEDINEAKRIVLKKSAAALAAARLLECAAWHESTEAGQPSAPTAGYALEETRVATAGVIRCCLQDVAREYEGERVALGYKSQCPHCKTRFTLVYHKTPRGKSYPLWKPDWQITADAKA